MGGGRVRHSQRWVPVFVVWMSDKTVGSLGEEVLAMIQEAYSVEMACIGWSRSLRVQSNRFFLSSWRKWQETLRQYSSN